MIGCPVPDARRGRRCACCRATSLETRRELERSDRAVGVHHEQSEVLTGRPHRGCGCCQKRSSCRWATRSRRRRRRCCWSVAARRIRSRLSRNIAVVDLRRQRGGVPVADHDDLVDEDVVRYGLRIAPAPKRARATAMSINRHAMSSRSARAGGRVRGPSLRGRSRSEPR